MHMYILKYIMSRLYHRYIIHTPYASIYIYKYIYIYINIYIYIM